VLTRLTKSNASTGQRMTRRSCLWSGEWHDIWMSWSRCTGRQPGRLASMQEDEHLGEFSSAHPN